jgi:hypothetical protein
MDSDESGLGQVGYEDPGNAEGDREKRRDLGNRLDLEAQSADPLVLGQLPLQPRRIGRGTDQRLNGELVSRSGPAAGHGVRTDQRVVGRGSGGLGGPPRLHRLNAGLLGRLDPMRALRVLLRLLLPPTVLRLLPPAVLRLPARVRLLRLIRLLRALSAGGGGEVVTVVPVLARYLLTTVVLVSAWGCCHNSSSDCRSRSQWGRATAPYGAVAHDAPSVY